MLEAIGKQRHNFTERHGVVDFDKPYEHEEVCTEFPDSKFVDILLKLSKKSLQIIQLPLHNFQHPKLFLLADSLLAINRSIRLQAKKLM